MSNKCKNCANCTYNKEELYWYCERRETATDGEASRPCFVEKK